MLNKLGIFGSVLVFILYMVAQLLFIKNLVFFGAGFCFLYVAFILTLDSDINPLVLMLIGFGTGLIADLFYNSLGIHMAACTLLAFIKPTMQKYFPAKSSAYETSNKVNLTVLGFSNFIAYSGIMVFIFCAVVFYLEASSFNLFWESLKKTILSSVVTVVVIFISQVLFKPEGSK